MRERCRRHFGAPDGVIQPYWRSQIAEMEHLRKTDPNLCVACAFPELWSEGLNST
jgi:hypothetical protein